MPTWNVGGFYSDELTLSNAQHGFYVWGMSVRRFGARLGMTTIRREDTNDAQKMNCDDNVGAITAARGSNECISENDIDLSTTPADNRDNNVHLTSRNVIPEGGNIHHDSVDLARYSSSSSALVAIMTARGISKCKDGASTKSRDSSIFMRRWRSTPRSNIISETLSALPIDVSQDASDDAGIKNSKALPSPFGAVLVCARAKRRSRRSSLHRFNSNLFKDLATFVNKHHGEHAELLEIAMVPFEVCFCFSVCKMPYVQNHISGPETSPK